MYQKLLAQIFARDFAVPQKIYILWLIPVILKYYQVTSYEMLIFVIKVFINYKYTDLQFHFLSAIYTVFIRRSNNFE